MIRHTSYAHALDCHERIRKQFSCDLFPYREKLARMATDRFLNNAEKDLRIAVEMLKEGRKHGN